ncbi:hypothetical protein ACFO6W_22725 [Dysgonomonas termitidis]|uniref:Uncharacterized protein n=1 Tax=Dysgonomonas termitidis TaxID=1516126 RepID=A0ABV9L3T3_9BACT
METSSTEKSRGGVPSPTVTWERAQNAQADSSISRAIRKTGKFLMFCFFFI